MIYKGYMIRYCRGYYQVISSDGSFWTEDTVEDAKYTIDSLEEE